MCLVSPPLPSTQLPLPCSLPTNSHSPLLFSPQNFSPAPLPLPISSTLPHTVLHFQIVLHILAGLFLPVNTVHADFLWEYPTGAKTWILQCSTPFYPCKYTSTQFLPKFQFFKEWGECFCFCNTLSKNTSHQFIKFTFRSVWWAMEIPRDLGLPLLSWGTGFFIICCQRGEGNNSTRAELIDLLLKVCLCAISPECLLSAEKCRRS